MYGAGALPERELLLGFPMSVMTKGIVCHDCSHVHIPIASKIFANPSRHF